MIHKSGENGLELTSDEAEEPPPEEEGERDGREHVAEQHLRADGPPEEASVRWVARVAEGKEERGQDGTRSAWIAEGLVVHM